MSTAVTCFTGDATSVFLSSSRFDVAALRIMSALVCSTRGQSATRRPASSSGSEMRNSALLHSSKRGTMTSQVQISSRASHQASVLSREHGRGRTTSQRPQTTAASVCCTTSRYESVPFHCRHSRRLKSSARTFIALVSTPSSSSCTGLALRP